MTTTTKAAHTAGRKLTRQQLLAEIHRLLKARALKRATIAAAEARNV